METNDHFMKYISSLGPLSGTPEAGLDQGQRNRKNFLPPVFAIVTTFWLLTTIDTLVNVIQVAAGKLVTNSTT